MLRHGNTSDQYQRSLHEQELNHLHATTTWLFIQGTPYKLHLLTSKNSLWTETEWKALVSNTNEDYGQLTGIYLMQSQSGSTFQMGDEWWPNNCSHTH